MSATKESPNQYHWHHRGATITPSPIPEITNSSSRMRLTCAFKTKERAKYTKLFKLLLLTAIPTLIVIVQSILNLKEDLEMFQAYHVVKDGIQSSIELSEIIHKVQIERGTTTLYVSSSGDPIIKQRLATFYKHTDVTIASFSNLASLYANPHFRSSSELRENILKFRNALEPDIATVKDVIEFYTNINAVLIRAMGDVVRMNRPFHFWTDLAAYELLILSNEEAGIERALGSTYFATGKLTIQDLLWYNEKKILGARFLNQCLQFSNYAQTYLTSSTKDSTLLDGITLMRIEIINNSKVSPSVQSGTMWFDNMTTYINILKNVQNGLAITIVQSAEADITSLEEKLIASAVQMVITIIMMPIVVILVRNIVYISSKLEERTIDLEEEKRQTEALLLELEDERKRTEELLHQLLPQSVARTLMENGCVDPESFDSVTVMFSDVVGFTTIASASTPMQVVRMLNKLYMTIDGHVEHVDAYKVETIGDAYMVASGLPKRNGETHVLEIAKLGVALLDEHMEIPHIKSQTIQLRIGINTGPCVAGVVGIRMPRYCIFGDTVNTASRMESTGMPGRIQMTESSASKLQKNDKFEISERGQVAVKGKGVMRTFWLERRSSNVNTGSAPSTAEP